jgi:hypothetical protein
MHFKLHYLVPHFILWDLILSEGFEQLGLKHNPYVGLMLDFLILHCIFFKTYLNKVCFSNLLNIWWATSGSQKRLMVSIVVLITKLDFVQEGWMSCLWINVQVPSNLSTLALVGWEVELLKHWKWRNVNFGILGFIQLKANFHSNANFFAFANNCDFRCFRWLRDLFLVGFPFFRNLKNYNIPMRYLEVQFHF